MDSKLVALSISTNLVTPSYKEVVCATDTGLNMDVDVSTVDTKCGVKKSPGSANITMNISGVAEFAPTSTQMSANTLFDLGQNGTRFLVKIADTAVTPTYYRQGEAFFSSYNETANNGEQVSFDATLEIDGDVDITP